MTLSTFKKTLLLFLLISVLPGKLVAQDIQLFDYEMDSIVMKFPGEDVRLIDTITEGTKLKQLYTTVGSSTYIFQKMPLNSNPGVTKDRQLPYDRESLLNYYEGVAKGTIKAIGAETVKSEEIKLGHLIGYKSIFFDSNKKPFYEMHTFVVNNNIINICCYEKSKINSSMQNKFFDSLDLDLLEPINQFAKEDKAYTTGYRMGYLIAQFSIYIIMALATIGLIWLIARKKKKKSIE